MTTPKLTGRELDAVIAEKVYGHDVHNGYAWASSGNTCERIPDYSSSLDALAPVVKKTIEKYGADYVGALATVLGLGIMWDPGDITRSVLAIAEAEPRQIAEAVVRCWE